MTSSWTYTCQYQISPCRWESFLPDSRNRAFHPGGNYRNYHLMVSYFWVKHCSSFEDRAPADFIQTSCEARNLHRYSIRYSIRFLGIVKSHKASKPRDSVLICWYRVEIWRAPRWHNIKYDDVIKWKHFPRYWPFVREIHRSPVNSPHKGQRRGALIFFLIWAWTNGCINNREAGDFRRHRAHYDATVMTMSSRFWKLSLIWRLIHQLLYKDGQYCRKVSHILSSSWPWLREAWCIQISMGAYLILG